MKANPEDKVLKDIDKLVDWQMRGGEDEHYHYRSYNAVKYAEPCPFCGGPADGHGHGGGGWPPLSGAIQVDDVWGGYITLTLPAGTYDVICLGDTQLPLIEPIVLDEPGALVIAISPVERSEHGEVFYIRVGRPRRTRLVEA
jgi:hypothetical protein